MFAMVHGKYSIITSYICNRKSHKWQQGKKMQNEVMTKPVKIVLSCLRITKLGHCYYFPSFKIPGLKRRKALKPTLPHLTLLLPLQQLGVILEAP